jgi:hypothetical protein
VVENTALANNDALYRFTQVIWTLFGLLEGLIAIRIILKLIAANPANTFARLIYGITDVFLWPFFGLTVTPQAGGMVLEIPSIVAMLVYALLGWLIVKMIWLLFKRTPTRSVTTYERDRTIR